MEKSTSLPKTAAIVIIGNEILTGKIQDQNSPFLIERLSSLGVKVSYSITIPDDFTVIAETVKQYSEKVNWMFTAGGIGPTPDDITRESIAKAYGVPCLPHPTLEKLIRDFYQDQCTPAHLKMANVPEGTQLVKSDHENYPQIQFRNIFIFPGVPRFLRKNFLAIEKNFQSEISVLKEIFLEADEGKITAILEDVLRLHPEIELGSYPEFIGKKQKVKLTLEHQEEQYVEEVYQYLISKLKKYLQ